jgi:hypothetical protein
LETNVFKTTGVKRDDERMYDAWEYLLLRPMGRTYKKVNKIIGENCGLELSCAMLSGPCAAVQDQAFFVSNHENKDSLIKL